MAILPVITIACLTWGFMIPAIKTRTGIQQRRERRFTTDAALTHLLDAKCGNGEFFEALFIIDHTTFSVQAAELNHG